jgi:beta-lactamase regulating signal transducer with metallopeptidase domain
MLTFTNTLVGLGGGPPLIAAATEYVYRTPMAVDRAISLVGIAGGLISCTLFFLARRALARSTAN